MRPISFTAIVASVKGLCLQAACDLPPDVTKALVSARAREQSALGRSILDQCIANAGIAARERIPLCQDTGFAVFFVELGESVTISGGSLADAIAEGTHQGYRAGFLRPSIVNDPVFRRANTGDNTPPVIHVEIVSGETLRITLAPKGAGCENMGGLAFLKPSEGRAGIISFSVATIVKAGGNPCPPTIVGIGVGGTAEKALLISKRALLRKVGAPHPDPDYATLERDILAEVNRSGIGPQGLGGSCTALSVHIEAFPCHIASLPVAVSINCHAARHASVLL